MIPQDCLLQETPSAAERVLFEQMREELPATFTVFHSVGIEPSLLTARPWSETDFVVVSQEAVFCIEVKGGFVNKVDGVWIYGRSGGKRRGPFNQANVAAASLHQYLSRTFGATRTPPVIPGVIFPDCRFAKTGLDIDLKILRDVSDKTSLSEYFERLLLLWKSREGNNYGSHKSQRAQASQVSDLIRGDFEVPEYAGQQVRTISQHIVKLTTEQQQFFEGFRNITRASVSGGPGTGKTLLAVAEARRLATEGNRVLLACFNTLLAQWLNEAYEEPRLTIRCVHELIREYAELSRMEIGPSDHGPAGYLNGVLLPAAMQYAATSSEPFEALVIDEGQDVLRLAYYPFFEALVGNNIDNAVVRIFYDTQQNVFGANIQDGELELVLDALGAIPYSLQINCRNTRQITGHVAAASNIPINEATPVSGPEVRVFDCRDQAHVRREVSREVSRLVSAGVSPDEIVVLGKHPLLGSSLRSGFEASCAVPLANFRVPKEAGCVAYSTAAAFKGLEAEIVMLIDFEPPEYLSDPTAYFVGGTRAKVVLCVFTISEAN